MVISMTRQANQTGQILLAILTAGTEQTPGTGAEDKMSSQLAGAIHFHVQVLLWLAGIRKMQRTQGRGGARSVKTWRLTREGNAMPNTATRWSFLGEVYYNKNENLL